MVGIRVKAWMNTVKVRKKTKASSIKSLGRAGAYIRGIARRSIKVSTEPSKPGKPPRSRKGQLKNAILYSVEKGRTRVVIGPTASEMGRVAHTHEFGGVEKPKKRKARKSNWKLRVDGHGPINVKNGKPIVIKLKTEGQVARAKRVAESLPPSMGGIGPRKPRRYPARPFMGPALKRSKARLSRIWANSVRGG